MDEATRQGLPNNIETEQLVLTIDLQTILGRVQGKLALRNKEMRLAEFAWNAMVLDERLIALGVASEARNGRQVSCRKGCGACCRQAVPISPPEAWMLWDLVASFPHAEKAAVLSRFEQVKTRLEHEGFGQRSLPSTASMDQVQELGLDYFRLGLPCPFLVEESCSIHPNRPSSCREYLVTTPPALCADLGHHKVKPVPSAANMTEALAKLAAILLCREPQVIPLALALDWAVEHLEDGRRRYETASLLTLLVEILTGAKQPDSEGR